jgi:hypothetical protein
LLSKFFFTPKLLQKNFSTTMEQGLQACAVRLQEGNAAVCMMAPSRYPAYAKLLEHLCEQRQIELIRVTGFVAPHEKETCMVICKSQNDGELAASKRRVQELQVQKTWLQVQNDKDAAVIADLRRKLAQFHAEQYAREIAWIGRLRDRTSVKRARRLVEM